MGDTIALDENNGSDSVPARTRLFHIASEQAGYFTARQARGCGFSWALLSHHVRGGRFRRVRRGLYRFNEYPESPREQVLAAWLAVGKDQSVVSHESALDILGLSDVIPGQIHLTVPRSRRNLPDIPGVRIHTSGRAPSAADIVERDGMRVTSAARTIVDAAESGTAPEQVEMAVHQAVDRGLATPQSLRKEARGRSRRVQALIDHALHGIKR